MFRKVPTANETHELSMDQLGSVMTNLNHESRELTSNELDSVSGGGGIRIKVRPHWTFDALTDGLLIVR